MKKILLSLMIMATFAMSFNTASAQTNGSLVVSDATLTDAQTITLTLPSTRNYYETLAVYFLLTRNSGTLAGTATLQGSKDNTNFVTVGTAVTLTNAATFDVGFEVKQGLAWNYYRVLLVMSGTQTSTVSAAGYTLKRK